jgi:hypothetical protein
MDVKPGSVSETAHALAEATAERRRAETAASEARLALASARKTERVVIEARNAAIRSDDRGDLAAISRDAGISRTRVAQIIKAERSPTP